MMSTYRHRFERWSALVVECVRGAAVILPGSARPRCSLKTHAERLQDLRPPKLSREAL